MFASLSGTFHAMCRIAATPVYAFAELVQPAWNNLLHFINLSLTELKVIVPLYSERKSQPCLESAKNVPEQRVKHAWALVKCNKTTGVLILLQC